MSLDVQPPLSKIEGGTEPAFGATACSQSGTDPCAPCRSCRKRRSLPCPENRNLQRGQPNPNVMEVHMICDLTAQIDIRKVAKMASEIPETIHFEGERIVTTWTGTNFGGRRQWFLCPSCDRRCAIIYRRGNGPLWCCRICGGGRYLIEHESPHQRKLSKLVKVRKRFGQTEGGILAPFPSKPKSMHPTKYNRIRKTSLKLELDFLLDDGRFS